MWALIVPSPNGTSVMSWFIFTWWAGAAPPPLFSSRIFLAASSHSSDRNWYFSATFPPGKRSSGGATLPRLQCACRLPEGGVRCGLVARHRSHDEAPDERRQL